MTTLLTIAFFFAFTYFATFAFILFKLGFKKKF